MVTHFDACFPNLTDLQSKITSPNDPRYNCIAWAFKDNRRWWWPDAHVFWPLALTGQSPMEAFETWFDVDGWEETPNHSQEAGYEKIALFWKDGKPTHAARLLNSGVWTSKLGQDIDISHDLLELVGPVYGEIFKIFRKAVLTKAPVTPV